MVVVRALKRLRRSLRDGFRRRQSARSFDRARFHPAGARIVSALSRELPIEDVRRFEPIETWRRARSADRAQLADSSAQGPVWDTGLTVADAVRASRSAPDAQRLFALVEEFRPAVILELGTNVGVSSAYMRSAQVKAGVGEIITFDGSPNRIRLAKDLHAACGSDGIRYVSGMFDDTLAEGLAAMPPVAMAFIDGNHHLEPTLRYTDLILGHAEDGCVLVFDDIRWSAGMKEAWRKLSRDPRFEVAVDATGMGICIAKPAKRG